MMWCIRDFIFENFLRQLLWVGSGGSAEIFLLSMGKTTLFWSKAPDLIRTQHAVGSSGRRLQRPWMLKNMSKKKKPQFCPHLLSLNYCRSVDTFLKCWQKCWARFICLLLSSIGFVQFLKSCQPIKNRVAPKVWSLKSRNSSGIKDSLAPGNLLGRVTISVLLTLTLLLW